MNEKKADFLLMYAAIAGGFGTVGNRIVMNTGLTSFQVVAGRMLFSALFCYIFLFKQIKSIRKEELKSGFYFGLGGIVGLELSISALYFTSASVVAFLSATSVIFVPVLSRIFFKSKLDWYMITGVILVFIGTVMLSVTEALTFDFGALMALLGALCYSSQKIVIEHFVKNNHHRPACISLVSNVMILLISALVVLFAGVRDIQITTKGVSYLIAIGVFSTALYSLFTNFAQKYTSATKASLFTSTESVFAILFSVFLLDYRMVTREFIAFAIIFAALVISQTKLSFLPLKKKEKQEESLCPKKY